MKIRHNLKRIYELIVGTMLFMYPSDAYAVLARTDEYGMPIDSSVEVNLIGQFHKTVAPAILCVTILGCLSYCKFSDKDISTKKRKLIRVALILIIFYVVALCFLKYCETILSEML